MDGINTPTLDNFICDGDDEPYQYSGVNSLRSSINSNNGAEFNLPGFSLFSFDFSSLEKISKIGEGCFGEVWKCKYLSNDQIYAVKYSKFVSGGDESRLDYFRSMVNEATCARPHKNLVRYFGFFTQDFEEFALVMEYVPRGSLEKVLKEDIKVQSSLRLRLEMALEISYGMNSLHSNNSAIIHRDLRSANILVNDDYSCKVGDFGLSIAKSSHKNDVGAYKAFGHKLCVAPEVFRVLDGNKKALYSCKSDIYSFGLLLIELITTKNPFYSWEVHMIELATVIGYLKAARHPLDEILPKPEIPGIKELIERCLQSDPDLRPTFFEIISELEHMLNKQPSIFSIIQNSDEDFVLCHLKSQEQSKEQWINTIDEDGKNLLHFAAIRGSFKIAEYLISLDPLVNFFVFDYDGKTPLHYACLFSTSPAFIFLFISTFPAATLPDFSAEYIPPSPKRLVPLGDSQQNLLYVDLKATNGMAPIHLATLVSNFEILKYLISVERVDIKSREGQSCSATIIHHAARAANIRCLQFILDSLSSSSPLTSSSDLISIESTDDAGRTALHYASFTGSPGIIKLLLEQQANPNAQDENGQTALLGACFYKLESCVSLLLDFKASPCIADRFHVTPLQCACFLGHSQIVRTLLDSCSSSASLLTKNSDGNSPLHIAALGGHADVCEMLILANADVNSPGNKGMTPLLQAIIGGNITCCERLMELGADIFHADEEGKLAIHWACILENKQVVDLLLEKDEDCLKATCKQNHTPLYYAIVSGLTPELGSLLTLHNAPMAPNDQIAVLVTLRGRMANLRLSK